MSTLSLQSVSYKNVLKDISFELEENTFNVLIGKNASGKTTLIKCIAGLLDYNGEIIFENFILDSKKRDTNRNKMGIFINDKPLIKGTVFDNLMFPLSNLGWNIKESKKNIYNITKKLGIDNILYKDVFCLTNIEEKLVKFAQSIIHNPSLLLIDETFDDLNNYYKNKIFSYLDSMKSTILFVGNNEDCILKSDKIIFIDNGTIVKTCDSSQIIENEKYFIKANSKLPFISELISKLSLYGLVENDISDTDELVDELWN